MTRNLPPLPSRSGMMGGVVKGCWRGVVLRGEVYPTPFDCPLRFWAVVWAPLYRAVRTRYKTTPSLGTKRGGARAGMKADAHRRQRTLSSFSRLDPLWVHNQSNTINAQEFHTRMGERVILQQQHQQCRSDIGDYTQPDISVGYYNNNINNRISATTHIRI